LERGLSFRVLARRLGLSAHSGLTDYETGRRIPPEDLIVAYERIFDLPAGTLKELRSRAFAQREEQRRSARGTTVAAVPLRTTSARRKWYRTDVGGRRLYPLVALVAIASLGISIIVITSSGSPASKPPASVGHRPRASAVPTLTPVLNRLAVPPKAPPGKAILRQGTTVLYPGEELDLDAARGWPYTRGASGDPWDVEFTLAYRNLEGETGRYTALAHIAKPTDSYNDCLTSDYSGVVPTGVRLRAGRLA
jgi:transcriptional regulator with XRE-family HTH domain